MRIVNRKTVCSGVFNHLFILSLFTVHIDPLLRQTGKEKNVCKYTATERNRTKGCINREYNDNNNDDYNKSDNNYGFIFRGLHIKQNILI